MKVRQSFGWVPWFWTLHDLVPPGLGGGHGATDTLEDAKAASTAAGAVLMISR